MCSEWTSLPPSARGSNRSALPLCVIRVAFVAMAIHYSISAVACPPPPTLSVVTATDESLEPARVAARSNGLAPEAPAPGQRILVTGGAGYIGSVLVGRLL